MLMKGIRLIAIVSAMTVSLASCVRSEEGLPDGERPGREIVYSLAPVKVVTKGENDDEGALTRAAGFTSFPADSDFGTVAYYLPNGKTWSMAHSEADNYIDTEKISCENNVWKAWESGKTYYWPLAGNLTFFSWAPYDLTAHGLTVDKEGGLQIKGWHVDNKAGYGGSTNYGGEASTDGSVDILTARTFDVSGGTTGSDGTSFSGSGVQILFSHALCKVRFLISTDYDDGSKQWTVEKAALRDIYTKADFSGGVWSNYSDPKDYECEFSPVAGPLKVGEFTEIFSKTMMLPQPVNSLGSRKPRIELTCWDGVSYKDENGVKVEDKVVLTGVLYSNNSEVLRWKEGTDITYHLYISSGEGNYIEFDATTGAWDNGGGGDIEMK